MTDTKFKSVTSQSSSQTGTLEEIQHLISCNIHWCGDDDPGDDDPAPALDTDKKLALSNIKSILDANHTIENVCVCCECVHVLCIKSGHTPSEGA